jgi:prepilin-type processing-associated H-X9-DG protein
LKQIGLAMHAHHDARGTLPAGAMYEAPAATAMANANNRANWGVLSLPYLEQSALFSQYNNNLQQTVAPNLAVIQTILPVMLCPSGVNGKTLSLAPGPNVELAPGSYRGVAGRNFTAFNGFWDFAPQVAASVTNRAASRGPLTMVIDAPQGVVKPCKFAMIQDGLSSTLLVGEYETATTPRERVYWGSSWAFNSLGVAQLESYTRIPDYAACGVASLAAGSPEAHPQCRRAFGSFHGGGIINFVFCDGSVQSISPTIDGQIFRALGTIAGDEVIPAY